MKLTIQGALLAAAAAASWAAATPAFAQAPYKPEYRLSTNVNNAFPLGRGAETWGSMRCTWCGAFVYRRSRPCMESAVSISSSATAKARIGKARLA